MSKDNERVNVLAVRARNVKLIKEIAITLDGEWHEIRGDSGAGKTAILQSIEGGLRGLDPAMVRHGTDGAEIEIELSEATVKRIIPSDGKPSLMVTDHEGYAIERAKEFLQALVGPTAFRPIEWVRLGDVANKGKTERLRRQRDQLLEAIPMALSAHQVRDAVETLGPDATEALTEIGMETVDFDQNAFIVCASLERLAYGGRKIQNDRVKQAENRLALEQAPETMPPDTPAEELEAKYREVEQHYWTVKSQRQNRANLREQREGLVKQIEEEAAGLPDPDKLESTEEYYFAEAENARSEVARLEEALQKERARLDDAESKVEECRKWRRQLENHNARIQDLKTLEKELAGDGDTEDLDAIQHDLEKLQRQKEARQQQDSHDQAADAAHKAQLRSNILTQLVEMFRDSLPKALLESADLPVEGLGVAEDMVTIRDVPLHQLGTSEQIRVGVLIASALNPRAGFVLVDGAESIGRQDRAALAAAAKEKGLQLILTIVDDHPQPAPGVTIMTNGSEKTTG